MVNNRLIYQQENKIMHEIHQMSDTPFAYINKNNKLL